jgi:hypothetical protein
MTVSFSGDVLFCPSEILYELLYLGTKVQTLDAVHAFIGILLLKMRGKLMITLF